MPKRKLTKKEEPILQPNAKKQRTKNTNASKKQDPPVLEHPSTTESTTIPQNVLSSLIQEPSWSKHLQDLFNSNNFKSIEQYLNNQWSNGKVTYPPQDLIFEAFNKTPFDKVKVVILGQDPYHDDGQVSGANFSKKL
jgi:hypothetical protein